MNDNIKASMVANGCLYAQKMAKSFKDQTLIVSSYNKGFTDSKDIADKLITELLMALGAYEKARIDYKNLPAAIKIKEIALIKICEKVAEYLQ